MSAKWQLIKFQQLSDLGVVGMRSCKVRIRVRVCRAPTCGAEASPRDQSAILFSYQGIHRYRDGVMVLCFVAITECFV